MENNVFEAISAIGQIAIDCTNMLHAENGGVMRDWYSIALQDLWKLFNAVNSRLLDEGKG